MLQFARVVDQLGQDLIPQRRPAQALLRYVVTQHPLLPLTQVRLSSEAQDLKRGRSGRQSKSLNESKFREGSKQLSHQLVNIQCSSGILWIQGGQRSLEGVSTGLGPCILKANAILLCILYGFMCEKKSGHSL